MIDSLSVQGEALHRTQRHHTGRPHVGSQQRLLPEVVPRAELPAKMPLIIIIFSISCKKSL